jgi:hypothetical protein
VGGATAERCGTERGGCGHARRRCEQLPPREAELAAELGVVVAIDQIVHDAPLHEEGCVETRPDATSRRIGTESRNGRARP